MAPAVLLLAVVACNDKKPTQPLPEPPPHNLIVNGSFETGPRGPLTGTASIITYAGSTAIAGWVVTGDNVDYYVGEAAAADSLCCMDLNGYFAAGGVAQSFATTPGRRYSVSFKMAGNPDGGPSLKQMRVQRVGQYADFILDMTGKHVSGRGWVDYLCEFFASSNLTTIAFATLVSGYSAYGSMLDLVDVRIKSYRAYECVRSWSSAQVPR